MGSAPTSPLALMTTVPTAAGAATTPVPGRRPDAQARPGGHAHTARLLRGRRRHRQARPRSPGPGVYSVVPRREKEDYAVGELPAQANLRVEAGQAGRTAR